MIRDANNAAKWRNLLSSAAQNRRFLHSGRNDNEGGCHNIMQGSTEEHYVTPFAENVLIAERD